MALVVVIICLSVLMHVSSSYQQESLTPKQLEVSPVVTCSGHQGLDCSCSMAVSRSSAGGSVLLSLLPLALALLYVHMMLQCLCIIIATSIMTGLYQCFGTTNIRQ